MKLIKRQRPPKGKLVLRKDAPNANGEYPIMLQYCLNGKIARTTFGCNVKEVDWDATNQMIRSTYRSYKSMNERLNRFYSEFECLVLDAFKERQAITIKEIRFILENKRLPNRKNIIEIGVELLELKRTQQRIEPSTYKNGLNSIYLFERYIREKTNIPLHDVKLSYDLVSKYISWRKAERKNSNETINKALTPIIAIAEHLFVKNILSHEEYDKIKHSYLESDKLSLNACDLEEEKIKYITKDAYRKLDEYQSSCNLKRTKEYIDMYKFSIFTGLRFSDILSLEWGNINFQTKILKKVLVKGKRRSVHSISLSEEAVDILEKWFEKTGKKRFVFGLLSDRTDLNDRELLRDKTQTADKCINRVLKDICERLSIPKITFHSGRHTFAIWALNEQRLDIKQISQILGHTSVLTTENYYAKYLAA